ncbi:hypothetical protein LINPERHAP2_LOCUS30084 [Linum perenne]
MVGSLSIRMITCSIVLILVWQVGKLRTFLWQAGFLLLRQFSIPCRATSCKRHFCLFLSVIRLIERSVTLYGDRRMG